MLHQALRGYGFTWATPDSQEVSNWIAYAKFRWMKTQRSPFLIIARSLGLAPYKKLLSGRTRTRR